MHNLQDHMAGNWISQNNPLMLYTRLHSGLCAG